MINSESLYLYEEILLLALKDKEGTFFPMVNYHFAIGGAILAELLLSKKIVLESSKKAKYIKLIDGTPFGDSILDESLDKIRNSKKRARIETWINRFANLKNLKHRAAEKLCWRGILKADEDTVLLIFKRKIYPEVNLIPEAKLIERLRHAIFTNTEDINSRTVILLSIAKSTGLLNVLFSKKELKDHKKRIDQIVNGEITGKATKEAIEAMHAAIMITCIIPTIITTTAVTS